MFRFEGVCKTYRSKRGHDCEALRDINLTLPDTGMVILVGRSGSGKSTLLNILGGLDRPTSGEVSFNGNKFSGFCDSDFANYRNNTLGFVFQEFNLIENIDVGQNVGIPLSLQRKKEKSELVSAALEKVGLRGYEKRKISELSGGQKQRIAIARALAKNPEVILADEPTGNLDSKTCKEIFDLLKELAKERLVVIVTHDHENAKRYHDYIIELVDGQIIFNNCPAIEQKNIPMEVLKTSLPLNVTAKMGAENLLKKPIRTVSAVLIAVLTIFCIILAQFFFTYSFPKAQAKAIKDKNLEAFSIRMENDKEDYGFDYSLIEYINQSYPKITANNHYFSGEIIVNSSADILNFGFEFIGNYQELDESSVYVTASLLESLYDSSACYIENAGGVFVKLLKSEYPPNMIVGSKIKQINAYGTEDIFIIAGVVDIDKLFKSSTASTDFSDKFKEKKFNLSTYKNRLMNSSTIINGQWYDISLSNSANYYRSNENITLHRKPLNDDLSPNYIILQDGTLTKLDELNLKPSEIILSLELYNRFFKSNLTKFDYVNISNDNISLRRLPEYLGTVVNFSLLDGEFTIAGVELDPNNNSAKLPYIILPDDKYNDAYTKYKVNEIVIKSDSVQNLESFSKDVYSRNMTISTPFTYTLKALKKEFKKAQNIFVFISIVLIVIMVLFVLNLISVGILSRTKEIGVLKALGAKDKDLFSIFFVESFIISAITFLICVGLSFASAAFLNYDVHVGYKVDFNIFSVNLFTALTIFIASFVPTFIATLIPLMKVKKMNPVDAIKAVS